MVQRSELPSGRTRTSVGDEWAARGRHPAAAMAQALWGDLGAERGGRERREEEERVVRQFKFGPIPPIGLARLVAHAS
jgi:hypothetical protein